MGHTAQASAPQAWRTACSAPVPPALQGTKKAYREPFFRIPSKSDPEDIRNPNYDDCSVPLVWWPWWPFNPGDFFLASVSQMHAMQQSGFIDHDIRFTPVFDGLAPPAYVNWYLKPLTNHKVSLQPCFCSSWVQHLQHPAHWTGVRSK